MKRTPVALLAALEALIALVIGVGVLVVPATLIWAIGTGFSENWAIFWHTAVDFWLLGNGVHLSVTLPDALVGGLGVLGASDPFVLSLAPLGVTALMVFLGIRAGSRSAEADHPIVALVAGVLSFALFSTLVVFAAGSEVIEAGRVSGFLFPPLVFGASMALGIAVRQSRRGEPVFGGRFAALDRLDEPANSIVRTGLRGGALGLAAMIGAASLIVTILLIINYPLITGLYESTQLGVGGGIVVTLAQLLYLPTFIIWAAAWLAGPGFALGTDSLFSPLGTSAGPIPALPIFGVLPSGSVAMSWALLLVPLLCGFLVGLWIRRSRVDAGELSIREGAVAVAASAAVAGIALGLLAWFAAGSFGPGRLAEMGPVAWLVGLVFLAEIAIGGLLGLISGSARQISGRI